MNTSKVIIGGLLAGLVINVIDFIVNVPLLGEQWMAATKALNLAAMTSDATSAAGWITTDFLAGIMLVWLYASIRPRYGAGSKTAMIAGFTIWFVTHLAYSSYVFLGIYPFSLIAGSAIGSFIATQLGAQAGCGIYKEG